MKLFILVMICSCFPVLYIVHVFQKPVVSLAWVVSRAFFIPTSSFLVSLLAHIQFSMKSSGRPLYTLIKEILCRNVSSMFFLLYKSGL